MPASVEVGAVRRAFDDPRVHLLLLVDGGVLRGTLERNDLPPYAAAAAAPALPLAVLDGRTVEPGEPVVSAYRRLVASGRRRLAVTTPDGQLLGLLCLRRDGRGFCTDSGVSRREAESLSAQR